MLPPATAVGALEPGHDRDEQFLDNGEVLTIDWSNWCNNERPQSARCYLPPVESEANYYAEINGPSNYDAANKRAA